MDNIALKGATGHSVPGPPEGWQPCTGQTRRCEFWKWQDELRPECCTKHLLSLICFLSDLFIENEIFYWLDYGCLLGAVRDGKLISWDADADFSCLKTQRERIVSLEPRIRAAGHELKILGPGLLRLTYSRKNALHADICLWEDEAGLMKCNFWGRHWPGVAGSGFFPSTYLNQPEQVVLEGRTHPAPSPVHDFLVNHRYGPNYLKPKVKPFTYYRCPEIGPDQLSPAVDDLLERVSMLDRRVYLLRGKAFFGRSHLWHKYWARAGDPFEPHRTEPLQEWLEVTIERLEQALAEMKGPSINTALTRMRRRLRRLAQRLKPNTRSGDS